MRAKFDPKDGQNKLGIFENFTHWTSWQGKSSAAPDSPGQATIGTVYTICVVRRLEGDYQDFTPPNVEAHLA